MVELPAIPTWPAIIVFSPIFTLCAICIWLSKNVFFPISVLDIEPRSIVAPQPISQSSLITTIPIWGYLKFFFLSGKNPNPFFPMIQLSRIVTLFFIIEFLMIVFDPILQLSPIWTFFSIIELWPIKQLDPILTFSPTKTFLPWLIIPKSLFSILKTLLSNSSSIESG